jgi:acetyl esterase/lipase
MCERMTLKERRGRKGGLVKPVELVHPELQPFVGSFPALSASDEIVAALRSARPAPLLSDRVHSSDHVVPGDPDVPVRVHVPKDDQAGLRPCMFSIHGGGYVAGGHEIYDALYDRLCPKLGVVGVSVDYRLAPETSYPGPLEDCYRALIWTFEHADELGVDRDRIGVHGGSAGGGLAAAVALLARDRGEVALAFQVLESPMLDDRQITRSSQIDGLPIWSRELNAFGWRSYLGSLYNTGDVPYTAAPARAVDLSGLPPALVTVGAVDGFLDEDVDYALRLNHAGVPAELHVYAGACHGYQLAGDGEISRQHIRDSEDWLARQIRA